MIASPWLVKEGTHSLSPFTLHPPPSFDADCLPASFVSVCVCVHACCGNKALGAAAGESASSSIKGKESEAKPKQ